MIKRWGVLIGVALVMALLLVAFGRGDKTSAANQPNTVQVIERDFSIASSQTTFQPGVAYHFVIVNASADAHEFMIGPQMPADMPMDQIHQSMLAMVDNIPPGHSAALDVTFPMNAATPAGHMGGSMPGTGMGGSGMDGPVMDMTHLEFSCHLPGHYQAGMMLPITIAA